ncbi:sugar transferase [Staphylococcus haemolyticus]
MFFSLPVLVIIFILSFIFLGKPVFFKQERAGLNGEPFNIIKFRTMKDKRDSEGKLLPNKDRANWFGDILRSTSIDELPQLFNVLKGDLSLVGPRPLHIEYNQYYNDRQKKRLDVRPGITGLAQINGRNTISWTNKFQYDTWYVENMSTILDAYIIYKTFSKVLKRQDINSKDNTQVERFNGNN